uniref:Uncharacterized protein n=1 Tax=Arundo donax TaxID=35708 RepID=A0A0A9DMM4_ARUDO
MEKGKKILQCPWRAGSVWTESRVGGGAGWETRTSERRPEAEMPSCRVDAASQARPSPAGNE